MLTRRRLVASVVAFVITFGALTMLAVIARSVLLSQHVIASGVERTDDPAQTVAKAEGEMVEIDKKYAAAFFISAGALSLIAAAIAAALKREPSVVPPPLPDGSDLL